MVLQIGTATVLERVGTPSTKVKPTLEQLARVHQIAGGLQDSCITVIENPSLNGYLGLLLALHFSHNPYITEFKAVLYVRANEECEIDELTNHGVVAIKQGFDRGIPYNFIEAQGGLVLPAPNIRAYEVAFISPGQHHDFSSELQEKATAGQALRAIYKLLADKVSDFSIEGGKLVLPANYASHRV